MEARESDSSYALILNWLLFQLRSLIARVELKMVMETILNLAWLILALVLVRLWLLHAPEGGASRRIQIAALAMLIVILFPVISVTDDLWSIQYPAETDTSLRRDYLASNPHSIFPVVPDLPELAVADPGVACRRLEAPLQSPLIAIDNPCLAPIENRPPPAA